MSAAPSYPLTLVGNIVVNQSGAIASGYITFETGRGKNGRILALSTTPPLAPIAGDIHALTPSQVIYPGMLNLHNHTTWDFIPFWTNTGSPVFNFDNRFEWQAADCVGYTNNVKALESLVFANVKLKAPYPTSLQLSAFSEIQTVCGGTTMLQESQVLTGAAANNNHILIRGTGNNTDVEIAPQYIDSAVKFFEPSSAVTQQHPIDTSGWIPATTPNLQQWQSDLSTKIYSALVHLSEGRFGNLTSTKDAYTRNEFLAFKKLVTSSYNAEWFTERQFNMIHGCGIDTNDATDIAFLKDYGISVLWSPVSNCMLYSDTIPITQLVAAGVNCVLTSDWAPSGSKHVWDEAKHAEILLSATTSMTTSQVRELLYAMITVNPAKAIGRDQQAGALLQDGWADLFILDVNSPITPASNAIDLLFESDDTNAVGTYTGGMLVMADPSRFNPPGFSADFQQLPGSDGQNASKIWVNFNANGDYPELDATDIASQIDAVFAAGGTVTVDNQPVTVPANTFIRSKFLVSDDIAYQQYMQKLDLWLGAASSESRVG